MTDNVNWWLMALAFALGLGLTSVFMIRRVSRDVPVYATLGRGPAAEKAVTPGEPEPEDSAPAEVDITDEAPAEIEEPEISIDEPEISDPAPPADPPAEDVIPPGPYGRGSAWAGPDGAGPPDWVVLGDERGMRYHTPDSPGYSESTAKIWFVDEQTARNAGFSRWDDTAD